MTTFLKSYILYYYCILKLYDYFEKIIIIYLKKHIFEIFYW